MLRYRVGNTKSNLLESAPGPTERIELTAKVQDSVIMEEFKIRCESCIPGRFLFHLNLISLELQAHDDSEKKFVYPAIALNISFQSSSPLDNLYG